MDYKIQLKDGYSVELNAVQHNFNVKVTFQFFNAEGKKARKFTETRDPSEISNTTAVGKELMKHIQDENLSKKGIDKKFEELLIEMSDLVENILIAKNEAEEILEQSEAEVKEDEIAEGFEKLNDNENPLLWIAQEVDWYTAGERMNILLAWICFCSQIILKNPISVIPLGEGGSGKTHIQDTALLLIPDEYIEKVKTLTDAALFAFCDIDVYYLDGMIVDLGDMGGIKDHEEAENFKNAMKEMQTDGYLARIKQVPKPDGGYENQKYELKGYPCITYTSVPGHDFDDQEQSRSIFLTPRDDNRKSYRFFKQLNKQKGTPSAKLIEEHQESIPIIKKMVLALRHRMENVNIYNPYWGFIDTFLDKTKYFKRDLDKYDGILRVITCINGYNRKLHEHDGYKTLFTTKEDITIFTDLLERYYESININLSPGASDILDILRKHDDQWNLYDKGTSVNEFIDICENEDIKVSMAKRSVQRYFSELNTAGLLKVIDKVSRSNVYVLNTTIDVKLDRTIELSKEDIEILEFNYGIDNLDDYEVDVSEYVPINSCRDKIQPFWNKFLPEHAQRRRQSSSSDFKKRPEKEEILSCQSSSGAVKTGIENGEKNENLSRQNVEEMVEDVSKKWGAFS